MGSDHTTQAPHTLGRALRALREHAEMTQEDLAARAGTNAAALSHLEHGQRDTRWSTLTRLLAALDADLHQLANAITATEAEHPPRH
jgi:transcriptional regulator with XRE-family HTH domain